MIILLNGLSGTGKSSIAKGLVDKYPNTYDIIYSYTTRKQRNATDTDHTFVSKSALLKKMVNEFFIARTEIDDNLYCAFLYQFWSEKIHLYTVDDMGIIDVLNNKHVIDQEIYVIRILGQHDTVDDKRKQRFKHILPNSCSHIDLLLNNDGNITINDLVKNIHTQIQLWSAL